MIGVVPNATGCLPSMKLSMQMWFGTKKVVRSHHGSSNTNGDDGNEDGEQLTLDMSQLEQKKRSKNRNINSKPRTPRQQQMGDYELLKVIGKGSFGKVFVASRKEDDYGDELFAVKVLNKDQVFRRGQVEHTLTEKSVMAQFAKHPFILGLVESFQTSKQLCIVSKFCAGGELFFHLDRVGRFDEDTTRFYMAEVCDALVHLHSHGVVYRDLKPENIMLDQRGHVRLGDFGLAKMGVQECARAVTICGSVSYMAPEMILCHRSQAWRASSHEYGYMCDWWSFGVMMYDMLIGQTPFYHESNSVMFNRILSNEPVCFPASLGLSSEVKSLIAGLLRRNPANRLCSKQRGGLLTIQQHAFFAPIDFDDLRLKLVDPPFKPHQSMERDLLATGGCKTLLTTLANNFDAAFLEMGVVNTVRRGLNKQLPEAVMYVINDMFKNWDENHQQQQEEQKPYNNLDSSTTTASNLLRRRSTAPPPDSQNSASENDDACKRASSFLIAPAC